MMFSAWKKTKQGIKSKVNGFHLLILFVLVLAFLKAGFSMPAHHRDLCRENVFVQIEGDIKYPGVYTFCQETSLRGLVKRAGGLGGDDTNSPTTFENILLRSGDRVYLFEDGYNWKLFRDGISAFYKITLEIPVSLNIESEEGLTAIPGIGPGLAKIIVDERGKRGGFKSLNELKTLYGIGNKVYQRIVPYVKL